MTKADEELIPARILNEFVYCPRLAYLEFVQSEWADNEHTAEGTWVHRRVDKREGWLPSPEEASFLPFRKRSVHLSAPTEGLVGVLDMVDGDGSEAIPVEYKKGRPPDSGEPAYRPELMQIGAQALLLIANGWNVTRGYFYYAQSREKIEVVIDDEMLATTRQAVVDIREAFAKTIPPAPLVADPKCDNCSLNGICLPDETYLLQTGKAPQEIRQLLAPTDDALPLYVQSNGLRVGISGDFLEIREHGKALHEVRLIDTSQVCLFGNIQISTQAVRHLAERNIPICYFSYGGWFSAITTGMAHKNVELRQAQYRASFDPERCLQLARRLVQAKILNARTFLRRNARDIDDSVFNELKRLAIAADRSKAIESLLGLEGMAAKIYFQNFKSGIKNSAFLAGGFDSDGRNRRPPRDPMNALFSYVYSLLVKELTVISGAMGFDPYLGFYHQPRYGKPALALDLMEEFRILVADSTVLNVVNNQIVGLSDFRRVGDGVQIAQAARKSVTEAFERRMQEKITHPWFKYRLTYRRVLYVQTRLLARHLMGEIPEFPAFLTR